MSKPSALAAMAAALLFLACIFSPLPAKAQTIPGTSIPTTVTQMLVSNGTSQAVTMFVTLPASGSEDGCTNSVTDLLMLPQPAGAGQPITGAGQQGIFVLPANS